MFRREFLIFCSLAAGIFLLVAAAGMWLGHAIKKDAAMISADTLPSLVDAGAAMAMTQENWLRVHLLLSTQSSGEQNELIRKIETNSNEGLWKDYGQSVYGVEERENYAALVAARNTYVQLRTELYQIIRAQKMTEAKAFLETKLSPAYEDYRELSKRLFEYNAKTGRERAASVIHNSRVAPFLLGGGGVVLFLFGLLVGLRGALTGLSVASTAPKTTTWNRTGAAKGHAGV